MLKNDFNLEFCVKLAKLCIQFYLNGCEDSSLKDTKVQIFPKVKVGSNYLRYSKSRHGVKLVKFQLLGGFLELSWKVVCDHLFWNSKTFEDFDLFTHLELEDIYWFGTIIPKLLIWSQRHQFSSYKSELTFNGNPFCQC